MTAAEAKAARAAVANAKKAETFDRAIAANVRLMDAAPDLLAAAEAMAACTAVVRNGMYLVCHGRNADYNRAHDALRAAIDKARGTS